MLMIKNAQFIVLLKPSPEYGIIRDTINNFHITQEVFILNGKKAIKALLFLGFSSASIYGTNTFFNNYAVSKKKLPSDSENYYKWKNLNIYYTKTGTTGSPVILLHDLSPDASGYEWNNIVDILAKNHRVYVLDLLGCGRSEKPDLTYTNFYYVQLLIDFIKSMICEKTFVVASGFTCSVALLAGVYDASKFSGMTFINPPSLGVLSQVPDKKSKFAKKLIETPLIGELVYNIVYARENIDDRFTEDYLYNPFVVNSDLVDTYYEAAHIGSGSGRFLEASIAGNYVNMNIDHAIKKFNVPANIIIGSAMKAEIFISKSWKVRNDSLTISTIERANKYPHIEVPDKTAAMIEKMIEDIKSRR